MSDRRYELFQKKKTDVEKELDRIREERVDGISLEQLLKRNDYRHSDLPQTEESITQEVAEQVEISVKYAGYIERQESEVDQFKKMESRAIPEWLDYDQIPGLKTESRQKLKEIQPATIGLASRISGINPTDVSLLMVWIKRGREKKSGNSSSVVTACSSED